MDEQNKNAHTPLIFGAMVRIMKSVKAVAKGEKNEQQNYMFRGIDTVMNELHDIFAENGVFILPEVLEYNVTEKVTGRGSILYYTRVKVKYHYVTEDTSEVSTINVGEGMDSGDKSMNKAMSSALKYSLMQILLIPTKEPKDADATTPEETRPRTIAEIIQTLDQFKDAILVQALTAIMEATDKDSLVAVWKSYSGQLQQNPIFSQCMSSRKKELGL